jgi:hypothetical protein
VCSSDLQHAAVERAVEEIEGADHVVDRAHDILQPCRKTPRVAC